MLTWWSNKKKEWAHAKRKKRVCRLIYRFVEKVVRPNFGAPPFDRESCAFDVSLNETFAEGYLREYIYEATMVFDDVVMVVLCKNGLPNGQMVKIRIGERDVCSWVDQSLFYGWILPGIHDLEYEMDLVEGVLKGIASKVGVKL